jgi:hypothetical protein
MSSARIKKLREFYRERFTHDQSDHGMGSSVLGFTSLVALARRC